MIGFIWLVAAEIMGVPVILRCTRSGFYIYVRASSAAVLRIIERILNLELLDGIRRGNRQPATTGRGGLGHIGAIAVRVQAVHHEIIVTASRAVRADLLASGPQLGRIHDVCGYSIRSA